MAFDPIRFYSLASELYAAAEHVSNEAVTRSVVSRAYYGAFLAARAHAKITSTSSTVHEQTANFFIKRGQALLGNRLNALRTARNDADYDCNKACPRRNGGQALASAKAILTDLGS